MIRKSLLLLASLALAISAHAQLGAYGTFTVDRLSGIGGSPYGSSTTTNDSVNPLGFTGGVFYDFKTIGPVRLGADLRGSVLSTKRGADIASNGSGARVESGLAGVRAVFHTPFVPLQPYLEGSAGIGRSNYGVIFPTGTPANSGSGLVNNFEYHVFAGLDIAILPIMSFRAFEVGYGGLDPFGANSHNYPLKSVSTGVVFHLPSLP